MEKKKKYIYIYINSRLTQRRNANFYLIYYYCLLTWQRKNRVSIKLLSEICPHAKRKLEAVVAVKKRKEEGTRVVLQKMVQAVLLTLNDFRYPRHCQWQQRIYIYIECMDFYFEIIKRNYWIFQQSLCWLGIVISLFFLKLFNY